MTYENTKVYFPFFSAFFVASCLYNIFKNDKAFKLSDKKDGKNTVILDPGDILATQKFNLVNFYWDFVKEKYCEEFLFNTALNYEIVFLTDNSLLDKSQYQKLDPYGCASYNIYCKNKKDIKLNNINRRPEKLIILAKNYEDYHGELFENILAVNLQTDTQETDKCKGWLEKAKEMFAFGRPSPKTDCGSLLDLSDFLTSLNNSAIKDCRDVLKKFRNKNFFETYEVTQKKVFRLRNLFSLKTYEEHKNNVKDNLISFYEKAKERLEAIKTEKC